MSQPKNASLGYLPLHACADHCGRTHALVPWIYFGIWFTSLAFYSDRASRSGTQTDFHPTTSTSTNMTDPAPGAPDTAAERRKSIGKYVKRMSSVFRRGSSSKTSAPSTPTVATSPSTPAPTSQAQPTATPTYVVPIEKLPCKTLTMCSPAQATTSFVPGQYNRSALQQERARALFAKYGLTLESHEWITAPPNATNVQRVEKPIRMRVHRSCHRCGTTYGADKICTKCEHKRCKKCPRYPKKKAPGEKGKEKAGDAKPKRKGPQLTIKSKSGGELVYQPVKQRIKRTCHKCNTPFIPPTAANCEKCQHLRCSKCPREPAKLKKWPEGYPGDADPEDDTEVEAPGPHRPKRTWRKPRQRIRWECEQCQTLFKEGTPKCTNCGHERCDTCTRKP